MNNILFYETVPPLKNNYSVKFTEYSKVGELLPHWHEHIELLYLIDGECELIVGGERLYAKAGDLAVVNSTEIHSFISKGELRYFCTLIYPDFFSDISLGNIRIKNIIREDSFIGQCHSLMNAECARGDAGSDMMLKSHTYALMAYLVRTASYAQDVEPVRKSVDLERLSLIAEYVAANYKGRITTKGLADMCYLTESHFCRFFKRLTGKSALEYVNGFRVERAAVLLSDSSAGVAEIAESVGFDDANYFARVFKNIKGCSPVEFRKSKKQEERYEHT